MKRKPTVQKPSSNPRAAADAYLASVIASLIAAHEREREAWRKERAELLTRIQAWDPNPQPEPAQAQPDKEQEPEEGYSLEQLALMGLVPNSGGGFVHAATRVMYERVSDFKAYQAFLSERGLSPNTRPQDLDQNILVGG